MTSRWKAALISSAALAAVIPASPRAAPIRSVAYAGSRVVSARELEKGSLLRAGLAYSDSLLSLETQRVDSIYVSIGYLGAGIRADTSLHDGGVEVVVAIAEGERSRVGKLSVSGADVIGEAAARSRIRPAPGSFFDPYALGESLRELLAYYNDAAYPYAQVWLTGFDYSRERNEVDIAVSISEGERAEIGRVVFEGISKTDSSTALRISRLRPGSVYRERSIVTARSYLRSCGLFETVAPARVERREGGAVDIVFPVSEAARSSSFQGAVGFSRREQGDYVLNGSLTLDLANIAGSGRRVHFDWLNNGESYSKLALQFHEPFLLSSGVSLDGELSQVVQDTVYIWNSGGLYVGYAIGPGASVVVGAAADRNVPSVGTLIRAIRERFRLGVTLGSADGPSIEADVEGAYRKSYLDGNRTERDGELLYHLEGASELAMWSDQHLYLRLVSEAVFSTGDVPAAELFPIGGATTLRGYREGQFRGERVSFVNLEYRFGEGGWLFLFDDAGAIYRRDEGWLGRNGVGFGIRSQSPLGVVVLSFGVGERLSLEGTRVHISLSQRF
jgi:outer membrane protein assembly factor BamA